MLSLPRFKYSFTPSWAMILITFVFFSLFIRLGLWQLQRAAEKQHLVEISKQMLRKPAIDWNGKLKLPEQYEAINVNGKFLDNILFLDNQHYNHRVGYNVLISLLLEDGKIIIIDKGWVLADLRNRKKLPQIDLSLNNVKISGRAYYPSVNRMILGEQIEIISARSSIIQSIDIPIISKFLQKSVYPFIIRDENSTDNSYIKEWSIVSMPPARHYGYAVQWFAFALVILIIFIFLNLKKKL